MEKDFDSWNIRKKTIQTSLFNNFVHTREVWWCALGLNIGDETDGKNDLFERPVLIVKKFNRNVVLIVPISTKIKNNIYYANFFHNDLMYSAIISQLRLISTKRLLRKIYQMDSRGFNKIREAVKAII
jgi:mRNA interferase MazF